MPDLNEFYAFGSTTDRVDTADCGCLPRVVLVVAAILLVLYGIGKWM